MTTSTVPPPLRRSRALLFAAIAAMGVLAAPACKRGEAPAAGGATQTEATAAVPTPAPEVPPVIHETAASGQPPFAGLAEPRGAAIDDRGRLWVADFGHSRVAIFDSAGGYLGGWGGIRGNGKFQLQEPASIAIHGSDVYVADTWNGRVQHFTTGGEYRETTVAGLYGPRGVAVSADGTVWISDSGNNRLVLCPKGRCEDPPHFLGKAGKGGSELVSPLGIAVGPSGRVYVADVGNHRIQVVAADGRFTRSIPVAAWNGPMEPYIDLDAQENIYVSVPAASRVEKLDGSGRVLRTWDSDDDGRKFVRPTGLLLDRKKGVLYVLNSGSNTVVPLKLERK